MTEYLFYVSLVFIPIACWIAYLLHQDGFDITTIILVLVLSYLMITAFPFSIQHLGIGITILVYGAIFAVLVLVMCKPELFNLTGNPELAGKSPFTVPGGETTVFAAGSASDKVHPGGAQIDAQGDEVSKFHSISTLPEVVPSGEVVSFPAIGLPMELVQSDDPAEEMGISGTEDNKLTDQGLDSGPEQITAVEQVTEVEEQQAVIMVDDPTSLTQAAAEPHSGHYPEEIEPQPGSYETTADDVSQADALIDTEVQAENAAVDSKIEDQSESIIDGFEQQLIAAEDYFDTPVEVDYYPEAQDNLNPDIQFVQVQAVTAADTGPKPEDHTELADWIEMGFAAKVQGDFDKAADHFSKALQASTDDELKYLLGMELVSILQNTGNYEQAEFILDDLIQTISAQPAIIMELRQQKQYVILLADELNRLGLAGTPIFEVPRFVRMKVNEKMLA